MRNLFFYLTGLTAMMLMTAFVHAETGKAPNQDMEDHCQVKRDKMVKDQIEARGITDPAVLTAMRKVPRHLFVSGSLEKHAHDDGPLGIGHDQTISQPYIVALMTELLQLKGHERVLEIGTGSGYQSAVLAEIADTVYSIEIVPELASSAASLLAKLGYSNVIVRCADGYRGIPEAAPFDAIIVTAAPDHIPDPLVEQLRVGGRMVIPVGDFYQELIVIEKTEDGVVKHRSIPVRFVPMTGEAERK